MQCVLLLHIYMAKYWVSYITATNKSQSKLGDYDPIDGKTKMTNLKEMAKEYVPPTTKNIADLEKFSVNIDIEQKEFERKEPKEGEEKTFTILVATIDEVEYRIPKSVIADLKILLENKPDIEFVQVLKSGEGLGTKYAVIPA